MHLPFYRLGSRGAEVLEIQRALAVLGLYGGAIDGAFGGATHAGVAAFQRSRSLNSDGVVGPRTWSALFEAPIREPALAGQPLAQRCLALTGSFETGLAAPDCFGRISGDFDGQGISYGALQWNFGQNTLQPLLRDMIEQHPQVVDAVLGAHLETLDTALRAGRDEQMAFSRSVQHPVTHAVFEPWRGYAKALGRTPEFQALQLQRADAQFRQALAMCADFGLRTQRAAALMFDVLVQNGSIGPVVRARIRSEAQLLPAFTSAEQREERVLEVVAHRRAEVCNPRWVDDVRARKLCIARGHGVVHGIVYDLDAQFGVGLRPISST